MKLKKILVIFMIVIICSMCSKMAYATNSVDETKIYSKGTCVSLLRNSANGGEIRVTKAFYDAGGKEFPAYCLNVELGGIGEYGNYGVTVTEAISNPLVWRAITNGYPYQSFQTLGVENEDEAYTATKQAVYCVLYDYDANDFERYTPIGEAGERTLNAMRQIVYLARNSSQTKPSDKIKIEEASDWILEGDYVVKTITVKADCDIQNYNISLSNDKEKQIKITDMEGNEITQTNSNQFKIKIPVKILEKDDNFELTVEGQLRSMPVLYGRALEAHHQNYALAAEGFEDGRGNIQVNYYKNTSKLIIVKKDGTEDKTLQGVEFQIRNDKDEIVYSNLTTNEKGEIVIEGILPGTYYLEEVKQIDGYKKLGEKVVFDITLNEELKLTITNEKEEVKQERPHVEKNKTYSQKMTKLPVTGM